MKINCLSCGHNIDLDDAYADHYEGEIKCFGCNARLEIRTEQGAVRCVHLPGGLPEQPVSAEAHGQAVPEEGAEPKERPYKAQSAAKQSAAAPNESDMQHASPANNRAA